MLNGKIHDFDWAIFNSYFDITRGYMGIIWGLYGDCMGIIWGLYGDEMEIVWDLSGNSLGTYWEIFMGSSLMGDSP